ncbi:WD-40 repeat-containing protein [Actinomadura pelletieri DSM 43383]|uniref:WD-40 repeat-containing protein n=1 Tax=Actinomadura pelletieri DSM 43383 TaxID=1120940 RepID=A0A495QZ71_9ACTN|nr:AAA family ATPase [Actinomadura pelletieri]RKS79338.1 WD-40 repeat-containing protein [Actinomadura pelletieri DSM 43383]
MSGERRVVALDSPGSRALVVGTGGHTNGSRLPDVPSIAPTVHELGRVLADRCGMPHVSAHVDPTDPREFLRFLVAEAAAAEDVFLFYYVGHGLIGPGGDLYLATHATEGHGVGLAVDALAYATVREALTECPARSIMVVLDCCFSGRARGSFGTAVAEAFELSHVRGSFLLSSASATEQALAPPDEPYTAFSGELLRFLREGDPAAPLDLTADDAFRYLTRALPARGFPVPHRRAGDRAGEVVLAPNPVAPPVTAHRPSRRDEAPSTTETPCPYRGLEPFTALDSGFFFGRDALVTDVLDRLAERQDAGPVAVVGRSGSGKSSLVQAGVLSAIHAGRLRVPGSRTWPQMVLKPGEHPLRALADRLADGTESLPADDIADRLRNDPSELTDIVRTVLRHRSQRRLVLVVDQVEELFTACTDEDERRAFVQAVHAASRTTGTASPLLTLLVVRADFYGHCTDHPELADVLRDAQIPVAPMRTAQLKDVIERPAEAAGLTLEEGLVDRLLQDLRVGPDDTEEIGTTLPLLSYALMETWRQREGNTLTLAGYQATGGIWRAVTRKADETYAALDPETEQRAARATLLRMVRLGDGTEDTRRRVDLADLEADRPGAGSAAVRTVLDAFVTARLITVADGTAELAHEALLHAWPLLRRWIQDDRADLLLRQELTEAARAWDHAGRDPDRLFKASMLGRVHGSFGDHGRRATLSPLEREFLDASAEEVRRQARNLRRRRAGALAAALLVVTGLAVAAQSRVYAQRQQRAAANVQLVRSSQELAATAATLRESDPAAALRLSLTAYRSAPTPEARASVYTSYVTPFPTPLGRHAGAVPGVTYAPNGRLVASTGKDGKLRLWTVTDPFRPVAAATLPVDGEALAEFSPNKRLLAAHTQRRLHLWDISDPTRPRPLATVPLRPHGAAFRPALDFAPDGTTLAIGTRDGGVELWDVRDPRRPHRTTTFTAGARNVTAIAYGPDGTLAVASDTRSKNGGRIRLWDVRAGREPRQRAALTVGSALALSYSGHLLASAGALNDLHLWDVTDPRRPRETRRSLPSNKDQDNRGVSLRPDGRGLVAAGSTGTLDFWVRDTDFTDGLRESPPISGAAGYDSVAYSPDGRHLLAGRRDGVVELRSMPTVLPSGYLARPHTGTRAFGHGGAVLITGASTTDSGPRIWDVRDPPRATLLAALPRRWDSGTFLRDGKTLISADTNGHVGLWDASDPRRPRLTATLPNAMPVAAGPEGLLATTNRNGGIDMWNIRDLRLPRRTATISVGATSRLRRLISPGFLSTHILGVHYDSTLFLFDVRDPQHPIRRGTVSPFFNTSSYIPSRRLLATGRIFGRGAVQLWDLSDPGSPVDITAEQGSPNALTTEASSLVSLSPQVFAGSAEQGRMLQLWDTRDLTRPTVIDSLSVRGSDLSILNISRDGHFLIGNSGTNGWQLWRVTGADRPELSEFAELPVDTPMEFRADSKALVANLPYDSNRRGNVLLPSSLQFVVWPLDPDPIYRHLCTAVRDGPTDPGWRKYLPPRHYRLGCT